MHVLVSLESLQMLLEIEDIWTSSLRSLIHTNKSSSQAEKLDVV